MKRRTRRILRLAADWPTSLLGGQRHRHDFQELAVDEIFELRRCSAFSFLNAYTNREVGVPG